MRIRRTTVAVFVALAPFGAASGQNPSPTPAAQQPVQTSIVVSSSSSSRMPSELRAYHLTDSIRIGSGARSTVQYTYKHQADVVTVYIMPYAADPPHTPDQATQLAQNDVESIRDNYYQLSQNSGGTIGYAVTGDRADVINLNGRAVQYYWNSSWLRRRGQATQYLYYAVYALPSSLVRIRGESPGYGSDFQAQLAIFGHDIIADMLALPATAPVAAGSGPAPAGPMPAVCAAMPPATDTINYGVWATLEAPARKDPLPPGYTDLVLDALRHGLNVPNPLGLSAYVAMSSGGAPVMVPAVYGEVEFTLDNQGKMTDVHLTQSSLSPALDQAIYDAPRRADSVQAFPAEIGVINPGPIRFYVSISPVESHTGRSMQLFGVRMPAWRPGSRPGIDAARDVKPVFPAAARQAGVGDSVTIQFVVDEHGSLIQRTMRLISAGHIEYAQSVMEAAIGSQYVPAMAAGCPVKGLIERTWQMSVSQ